MQISAATADLFFFLLATPLGEVATLLAGGLVLAGVVDGVISAVQVIRR
jgi:hypothetical protein